MASTALATLTSKLAATLNMGDGAGLMETLKATRQPPSRAKSLTPK
jgi:hypothetical protein